MSSREYIGKRIVVWPENIDSRKSRGRGRKVPLKFSVKNPTIDEIYKAAEKLGLNPEIEEKKYPKNWWESKGRVVVDKKGSKLETLKLIAIEILKMRGETVEIS